jgi:hypothetical protein
MKVDRYCFAMVLALAPLLFSYVAASYLIFALPDSSLLVKAANFLFPLWNTGYSITIDEEALALVVLISALAFLSVRRKGPCMAMLHAVKWAALSVIPLGIMILASPTGHGFFFTRVANFQAKYDFLPWFTNEDLLILALALYGTISIVQVLDQRCFSPGKRGETGLDPVGARSQQWRVRFQWRPMVARSKNAESHSRTGFIASPGKYR